MLINKEIMKNAIEIYKKEDYPYHFQLDDGNNEFVTVASRTFGRHFKGNILAYMSTSLLKIDLLPRGYLVTDLFIYGDEISPIFIFDIKEVSLNKGMIHIYYHNGGQRDYEGGTFYKEVYNLLCVLKQEEKMTLKLEKKQAIQLSILTYLDDGGYCFKLTDNEQKNKIKEIYQIQEEILGYMDTSVLGNYEQGFIVSEKRIYSEFFTSHKQEPIDLNDIDHLELKRNRLIIVHLDQHKSWRYVSVYGNDLQNLIELYLKMIKES